MNRQPTLLRASILSLSLSIAAGVSAEATSSPEKPKAAAPAKAAPAKADKSASAFQGKFKWTGNKDEKKTVSKAVDNILYSFDENIRMMAKEKLDLKTHIPEWIDIKNKGGKITIHAEGRFPEVYSLSGPTDGKDPDGNPAELRLAKDGEKYIQTVTTSEGKRVNTYTVKPDGLVVNGELHSPRFPAPIKYTLTYTKSAGK